MKKTFASSISFLLALALIASLLVGVPVKADAAPAETVAVENIRDGLTLHCWNWSFAEIEANMATIAALGYTAIQTSPIQQAKQPTDGFPSNDWWVYYQPMNFSIDDSGTSALGKKADFESMCEAAHSYGIKVIVDVVANHMGNGETGSGLASTILADLKDDPDCWHDITKNTNNYSSRLEVTQYCMAGLPDLNTANEKVQNYVLNFLKECIDAGADGFRFDAVKHIETPEDGDLASNFWPTVIDGAKSYAQSSRDFELYCYGELLDTPGGSLSTSAYTTYMSVTDNAWSSAVLGAVVGGNAGGFSSNYYKGSDSSLLVVWPESHDTFADGSTKNTDEANINKAWALMAARTGAMGLYLARPANMSQLLGAASDTAWSYPEVAAVNHFHNAFVGQSEYVANENGVAYVERGDAGVVLVNCKGGQVDVNVTANAIADGTYTDQITGNTFTVADGKISGTIGDTGIAVVYDAEPCAHEAHDADGFCTNCSANVGHDYVDSTCACGAKLVGERTIYFVNSSKWDTVNFYSWYDDINIYTDAWPGNAMTHVEGDIYSCVVPEDIPNIIFNDGDGSQTEDLRVPALSTGEDQFTFYTRNWGTYSAEEKPTEPAATEPSATQPGEAQADNKTTDEPKSNTALWIGVAVGVVVVIAVVIVILKKKK